MSAITFLINKKIEIGWLVTVTITLEFKHKCGSGYDFFTCMSVVVLHPTTDSSKHCWPYQLLYLPGRICMNVLHIHLL